MMLRFLCAALFLSVSLGFDHPRVACSTTKGPLLIEIYRDWSPLGAARFLDLVKDDFFTDIAFFRCVRRFLTQFGISDVTSKKHWHREEIPDDPNLHLGIKKNYLSFAGGGPNTRSTQLFIAFEDLDFLGKEPWETPFGQVIEGQQTLDNLYKDYGDIPPFGKGPDQQKIHNRGNAYVRENFPKVDFIQSCHIVEPPNAEVKPIVAAQQEVKEPVHVEDQKVQSLRSSINSAVANDAEVVTELIGEQVPAGRKQRKDKEDELIITAIIFLGVALTALYIYVRCTTVNVAGKTL